MFNNLLNALPLVKESICYCFQYYLGIEINIDNLSLDQNNNINLHLTNISIEPNKINGNFLRDLNIKLTKGVIEKLQIKFGVNEFELKISKISIFLMPVILLYENNTEEKKIKEENNSINIDNKSNNNQDNNSNNKLNSESDNKSDNNKTNNSGSMLNSLIDYYLNKLKISIDEINIYFFNYEINNKNISFANPVLSLHLYKILYEDIKNENNINNIENNQKEYFWIEKHFSIATISVKIIKSFDLKNKDGITQSSYNTTSKNNILLFNEEKGIHFYSNKNKEIKANFGDIQIIMDLFQLELLKNFIDTYTLYFKTPKNKRNININNENNCKKNNNISTNNSKYNIVMNLKIELNSFSFILFENSHKYSENPKFFNYSKVLEKNKFFQHFCYFEDNFFVFAIKNIFLEFNSKTNKINFSIDEIDLNYVEYNSKIKNEKNNEKDELPKMGSYYSECNDSMIFKSNDLFLPTGDENTNLYSYEYFQSFDFQFFDNEILIIKNIKLVLGLNDVNHNLNQIKFSNNNININFHPFLIFKMMKFLYENTLLIKEIIFYNYEHELIINKDINDKENNINNENNNECNLSFLSINSEENSSKSNININKAINSSDIIKTSDIENTKNDNNLNETHSLKNFIYDVNIEISFKNIEIRVYSFKYESDDNNIINPFLTEFYYENICIMDIKDEFKEKKLKCNQITSNDYFCLSIKNIKLYNKKNKNDEVELKINSLIFSYNNSKILQIINENFICGFLCSEKKLVVNLNLDIYFELKNLTSIISFINIWKNTILIYGIFSGRMEYNFNKGQKELKKMNFDKKILKSCLQHKNKVNYKNNISTTNNEFKFAAEIKIKKINIYLDVLPKKIKIKTYINNIKLTYVYSKNTQKEFKSKLITQDFEFILQKIESKELGFYIKDIQLKLNITKYVDINKNNINGILPKKDKKFFAVIPEENMDIYINRMIKYNKLFNKNKNNMINNNKPVLNENNQLTTKININIIIQNINIFPIENLLYINDIYNIIIKDELYNNSFRQENNENVTYNGSLSSSNNSSKIIKSIISNKIYNFENDNRNNKINDSPFIINFLIKNIEINITDKNKKTIILNINDLNLVQNILKINKTNLNIFYEIKEQKEKIKVNIGLITDINLSIMEKYNFCCSYMIKIKEINFNFCEDSFHYLQKVADDFSDILSQCFIKPKKNNKIVVTQKSDHLISVHDITEENLQNDCEDEIFGKNVADSICLMSGISDSLLDIDYNYLDNLKNEKDETNESIDNIYKSCLKERRLQSKISNDFSLNIEKICVGLYGGLDFESELDIKIKNNSNNDFEMFNEEINELKQNLGIVDSDENKENNNNNNFCDNFELIEINKINKINSRELDNYILCNIENLSLCLLYEKSNSYEVEFKILNFEIMDLLKNSAFKRLFSRKQILNNKKEEENYPFLSVFVDISNAESELNQNKNNISDYNIACEVSIITMNLMANDTNLLFLLNFFLNKNKIKNKNKKEIESISQMYNIINYHTGPSYVIDSVFNQIIVEDYGDECNDLINDDKNFMYITNFIFKEFYIFITYESNNLRFNFQNISIPIIPNIKDYPFCFTQITYKGFVTLGEFTNIFVSDFLSQLSKYQLVVDLFKSLSWTKPIINLFEDIFDIFISPFQSYKKNQGFMEGLFKGIKKFLFNILSNNVYVGEKIIRTFTTFIGVTENNNIGKNSFYEKYILTDDKKKIYDYFYK